MFEKKFKKFCDREIQNFVTRKIESAAGLSSSNVFGVTTARSEQTELTEEKLIEAINFINKEFRAYPKDTISLLASLGFIVTVNQFNENGKPIIILPSNYREALEELHEERKIKEHKEK